MVESAGILIGLILVLSFIGILDFIGVYKKFSSRMNLLITATVFCLVVATMFLLI